MTYDESPRNLRYTLRHTAPARCSREAHPVAFAHATEAGGREVDAEHYALACKRAVPSKRAHRPSVSRVDLTAHLVNVGDSAPGAPRHLDKAGPADTYMRPAVLLVRRAPRHHDVGPEAVHWHGRQPSRRASYVEVGE
eukprot:scaffold111234_cov26-Tisochrysis_lutea.AAC.2